MFVSWLVEDVPERPAGREFAPANDPASSVGSACDMVPSMTDATFAAGARALGVLWSDDTLLAVDKPAGELSAPGRGADKQHCTWARVRTRWPDALVVHRLDEPTSGLMLFARGVATQRQLSRAFAERRIAKRYVAIVHGLVREDSGLIVWPLAADWPQRPRQRIDQHAGKPAITEWRVLQRDATGQRTRVLLLPLTGRTHQLRVHLAATGHAIVGDALYGAPRDLAEPRLLLHASELQLAHPLDGTALQLQSQPPF
jgi:tRNA pseudouridine32 synthase/23S rRNA pseudouridine746 synthase